MFHGEDYVLSLYHGVCFTVCHGRRVFQGEDWVFALPRLALGCLEGVASSLAFLGSEADLCCLVDLADLADLADFL